MTHVPALDGLRALAVIAVLLFHGRLRWASGGFLGVTSFFALSGFLITGLLLSERDRTGRISLTDFWVRRARRLAPAVLVLFGLVLAYVAFSGARMSDNLRGDGVAALLWVSNWRFIAAGQSYSVLFSAPTPFQHMWSLAIEEQLYLVFPVLAMLLLGRRGRPRRWALAVGTGGVVIASTIAAALLHPAGAGPGRAYYGTDARLAEPMVGALLALLLVGPRGRREVPRRLRRPLDASAVAALVGLAAVMTTVTERSDRLYRGGFLFTSVLTAVVIAAATQHGSIVGRALSLPPLVTIGRLSYGIYLFHWPIFLWVTATRTGLSRVPLLALQCALTLLLAAVSYALVEAPIRRGAVRQLVAGVGWANAAVGLLAGLVLLTAAPASARREPASLLGTVAEPAVAAAPTATTLMAAPSGTDPTAKTTTVGVRPTPRPVPTTVPTTKRADAGAKAPGGAFGTGDAPPAPPPAPPATPPDEAPDKRTHVAVVGDSMAEGLGRGLEDWARARDDLVIYNLSIQACPLSSGLGDRRLANGASFGVWVECEWWKHPDTKTYQDLVRFGPDVIVMQDAMNELFDRKLPSWSEFRHAGQSRFDQWLREEYTQIAKAFTDMGATLLLLNAVCADWERMGPAFAGYADGGSGNSRNRALNSTSNAIGRSGVAIVDFNAHLCPNGRFTQTVDGVADGRPDGYHLSEAAAVALAEHWLGPLVLSPPRTGGLL